ncbi:MAG: hypothetical protein GQ569_11060 [Methylococcaceae bacterium]|nr:hypothetical protein [Methylococcaceae bacterium]
MAEFTKITEALAATITATLELSDEANVLLGETMTPADYLQQLMDNALYNDAINFLANALPKREAVWWACVCAKQTLNDKSPASDVKAVELAEAWVYKPVQEVCEPNYAAAEATEFKTPAGWAAISAFWSGENISPSKEAIVPPPEGLTGKAVNGAVILAAVQEEDPKIITANYQLFLAKGVDVACGGDGRQEQ